MLTALSVLAAAALGGAVAIDVTMLVIAAVAVLALVAVVNAFRSLGALTRFLQS